MKKNCKNRVWIICGLLCAASALVCNPATAKDKNTSKNAKAIAVTAKSDSTKSASVATPATNVNTGYTPLLYSGTPTMYHTPQPAESIVVRKWGGAKWWVLIVLMVLFINSTITIGWMSNVKKEGDNTPIAD